MTHSLHLFVRLLLLFLALYSGFSIAKTVWRKKSGNSNSWRNIITTSTKVSLPHDLAVFALGFLTCLSWLYASGNTYRAGYVARDLEAYSSLHVWSSTDWTIQEIKSPWIVIQTDVGNRKTLKFCEEPYLRKHWKITGLSAYLRGDCFSLNGPQGAISIDREPDGQPIIHQVAMK